MAHDTMHNIAKHQCDDIPNPQERQECRMKHQQSNYQHYKRTEDYQ